MSLSWTEYLEGWALRSSRRWSADCQHLLHPLPVELEQDLRVGDLHDLWDLGEVVGPAMKPDGPTGDGLGTKPDGNRRGKET